MVGLRVGVVGVCAVIVVVVFPGCAAREPLAPSISIIITLLLNVNSLTGHVRDARGSYGAVFAGGCPWSARGRVPRYGAEVHAGDALARRRGLRRGECAAVAA
jgi:hypothetical protein